MKKWLSILGIIGFTASSTTSLISCQKPNNNENKVGNKLESKPQPKKSKAEQPPKNSNWKLVENIDFDTKGKDKWYLYVLKLSLDENSDYIFDLVNAGNPPEKYKSGYQFALYRWDGEGEPEIPTIDNKTGKITDWKG